jgi:DNA modification methylase
MTVRILLGDVRQRLADLQSDSVDCVVTSPPYWGLRDYDDDGQIGLEPDIASHIAVMVDVFEHVRRVLKPSGTCWVNYGDCYATRAYGRMLKHKDLCMVPARFAIALQEAGWWLRSEVVWSKPNPMPESVTDRPATAHEKIFLLTKSPRYFYDASAVRVAAAESSLKRWAQDIDAQEGSARANGGRKTNGRMKAVGGPAKQRGHARRHDGLSDKWDAMSKAEQQAAARNLRNVWTIATQPFKQAHFATFPPALVEPCIKAGCPQGGLVLDPFGGAGTTGLVASRLQRDAILIELNPDYGAIARSRIEGDEGLFATVSIEPQNQKAEQ